MSVLPALAITLHHAFGERARMHARVFDEAERLATAGAARQRLFIQSVQSRLAGLAAVREIRDPAAGECDRLLHEYSSRWQGSYGLVLFDPDGRPRCHGVPEGHPAPHLPESASVFARSVAESGRFTLGRYLVNPATGRAFVIVGHPVADGSGRVNGVLTASREISWLDRFRLEAAMPPQSVVLLVAPDGQLLARVPALPGRLAAAFDGRALLDSLQGSATQTVEMVDVDGEQRVHAFARLPGSPTAGEPYLIVGLSHDQAYADANAALRASLVRLAVMTLLVLAVAAIVGELLVLRRVRALLTATERVAAGDLETPVAAPWRDGEIGRITDAFERMRVALGERERETREALAALRRSEERYRALVHGTSQIVWSADALGRLVEDQPSWRAVTGQSWEEIRGHGWLDALHPDDRRRTSEVWREAFRHRQPYTTEYRVRTAEGDYRPYASHGYPLLEPDGSRIREWVGFCVDLTDRRAAEEALRVAEEARRQGQKMEAIGRLAGGVAHDFNNVLAAVTSYAQLLLEDRSLAEGHRADVQEIRRAADRATALVRQLLAFGSRQAMRVGEVALDEMIGEMEDMLRRLLGAEYPLDVRLDPEAGAAVADRSQLEQVVVNLVLNARDAMPDGGPIVISTGVGAPPGERGAEAGRFVWLRVEDEGTGMDEATRARIFEPFFTTKEPGKGTGLGLATVYGTVHQSGGHITVESAPGAGTRFTIHLPRAAGDASPADARPGAGPRATPPPAAVPPAVPPAVAPPLAVALGRQPVRILVADDEPAVRHAAARALRRLGYEVLEAEDGARALELAGPDAGAVDLVLSDVVMPRMNGVELGECLRALRPDLPLVLMTGFAPELARRAERVLPGVPLVAKPFDIDRLTTLVGDLLAAAVPLRVR